MCLGGGQAQQIRGAGSIKGSVDEPRRQQRQYRQRDDGQDGRDEDADARRQAQ